jgi:hypothetical protein
MYRAERAMLKRCQKLKVIEAMSSSGCDVTSARASTIIRASDEPVFSTHNQMLAKSHNIEARWLQLCTLSSCKTSLTCIKQINKSHLWRASSGTENVTYHWQSSEHMILPFPQTNTPYPWLLLRPARQQNMEGSNLDATTSNLSYVFPSKCQKQYFRL